MTDADNYRGNHDASDEDAQRINSMTRYVMYSVFRTKDELGDGRFDMGLQTQAYVDSLADKGVVVRGIYDVGGLRADADLMVWWHAESPDALQDAYRGLLRTPLGRHLDPVWSQLGVHRPSEFNKRHVPGFLATDETSKYLCVYPFVRSYDWYVLEPDDRARMLREHGMAAKDYPDVRAHTVAAFALGDYEWLLAFEADELHRITDLMRELRGVDARLHVREEIPFYTGPKTTVADFVNAQR